MVFAHTWNDTGENSSDTNGNTTGVAKIHIQYDDEEY